MIKSFSCKETAKIFGGEVSGKFPREIQQNAYEKLHAVNRAEDIFYLRIPPSNRLEKLTGKLRGFWSIRINRQWRIVFKFEDGNASDVRICDYH
ncbi:MAG: type II toxin-antitoxin system RelE/ParE family toxin [Candidatus Spyradosoma sp.]